MTERQFAFPRRQQRAVVATGDNTLIWAVNIGSLAPATHPLTGHSTGVAGLFQTNSSGNLETTNGRKSFIRRDMSGTIADGTLIQLDYVSGRLTIVWADCSSHVSIEAQVTAP